MKIKRRKSRKVWVGRVAIGGDAPVSVQSMAKTSTSDISKTIKQIKGLEDAGCQIVRVAVPDIRSAQAIKAIKKAIKIPLVADIHFNYRLALESLKAGADKIRLNPGNVRRPEEIEAVIKEAKKKKVPIRIGVNSGSVDTAAIHRGRKGAVRKMAQAALNYIEIFERLKFKDIVISMKGSNVADTIESYRMLAKKTDYPFHLGVTAAGPLIPGLVKSSLGIGCLLMDGIGDTLRVSLTGDPVNEVRAGYEILRAAGIKRHIHTRAAAVEIISCPTCGRCKADLVSIVEDFEKMLYSLPASREQIIPLKVAIMGCVVNGPGEARESDIGIAFGGRQALFLRKGMPIRKIDEKDALKILIKEVRKARFT